MPKSPDQTFRLEALCDFPDDAEHTPQPLSPDHIDTFVQTLCGLGIRRLAWSYYADERGGHILPCDPDTSDETMSRYRAIVDTYSLLGNPLAAGVRAGHRHGLEVYGNYKPYETGPGIPFPLGSPQAKRFGHLTKLDSQTSWLDPFVRDHPHLRIKRRSDDIPTDNATRPVATIKLFKCDDSPTRITKEHLQIWASSDNYQYKPLDIAFDLIECVETAERDVYTLQGTAYHNYAAPITRTGDAVRTLTIQGLDLDAPFILITTHFKEGKPDFFNPATAMMRVYNDQGREIVGVLSNGSGIYNSRLIDFRNWGLLYDHGYGCMPDYLDGANDSGRSGLIAFARGRNTFLDGALCETEPEVQQFWLQCVAAILDTGVDGIDFRIENHSTHTDFPFDYGYNPVVLDQCRDPENPTVEEIRRIRGDAYTAFLRKARNLITRRGKKMRINLELDYLRPDPLVNRLLAYPANMDVQWEAVDR